MRTGRLHKVYRFSCLESDAERHENRCVRQVSRAAAPQSRTARAASRDCPGDGLIHQCRLVREWTQKNRRITKIANSIARYWRARETSADSSHFAPGVYCIQKFRRPRTIAAYHLNRSSPSRAESRFASVAGACDPPLGAAFVAAGLLSRVTLLAGRTESSRFVAFDSATALMYP